MGTENYVVRFRCPECGGQEITQVTSRVIINNPVREIDVFSSIVDRPLWDNDYVDPTHCDWAGAETEYICEKCGWELPCSTMRGLLEWLKKNEMLEENRSVKRLEAKFPKLKEYDLSQCEPMDWYITLHLKTWHDPRYLSKYGLPDAEEIKDYFEFFIDQGHQDLWSVAVIDRVVFKCDGFGEDRFETPEGHDED